MTTSRREDVTEVRRLRRWEKDARGRRGKKEGKRLAGQVLGRWRPLEGAGGAEKVVEGAEDAGRW